MAKRRWREDKKNNRVFTEWTDAGYRRQKKKSRREAARWRSLASDVTIKDVDGNVLRVERK